MSELRSRIKRTSLHARIMTAADAIGFFADGMTVGFSGFSGGHPKAVPRQLARHVEENGLQGKLRFDVFTGASIGAEIDNLWASLGMTRTRTPYQNGAVIRQEINRGNVRMIDRHLSLYAQDLASGAYPDDRGGRIDIGLVEAVGIDEDGGVILSSAVGIAPEIIQRAEKLIIEINTTAHDWEGVHDIYAPERVPDRRPIPITGVADRIGTTFVPCRPEKIVAIVESLERDPGRLLDEIDDDAKAAAGHILEFFQHEVKAGRLRKNLLPLQSGVGNIANAVMSGLVEGPFTGVTMWTEILQDTALDFFDSGKLAFASATSFSLSPSVLPRLYERWKFYTSKVVLRPVQISNHPETVRRLGIIAMNTPMECDIYAHCNSTLARGTRIINGIGGSGDFLRNAYLSIVHTPSTRPTSTDPTGITCIVPMATHVDHTEHDVDVLVTERGLADLRGLCPRERAQVIIDHCVHPDYRPIIQDYLDRATRECIASAAAHEPHSLRNAFKMQRHLDETGTMKIPAWD